MAVPFSKTTLRVPLGFQGLLEGLVREILLTQPNDIYGFAAVYFENMLGMQAEGSDGPATRILEFNDRLYNNKAFERKSDATEDTGVPVEAVVTIQAKYRQHQAKSTADEKRQENAAVKIQSSARGFVARKRVKKIRANTERINMEQVAVVDDIDDDVDKELLELMDDDETVGAEKSNIALSTEKPEDEMIKAAPPQPVEEVVDIDLADPEVQKAAIFIQSGFKGFKAKKFAAAKVAKPSVGVNTENAVDLTSTETQNHIAVIQASLGAVMTNLDASELGDDADKAIAKAIAEEQPHNGSEDGVAKEDDTLPEVDLLGEEDGIKGLDVPSDAPTEYVEEDREEPVAAAKIDDAVTVIQAGFRGMQMRRDLSGVAQVQPDEEEVVDENSTGAVVHDN